MTIQVDLREGLGHSTHFRVLKRCRRAGIRHCGERREAGVGPARRLVVQILERSRTYEQCNAVQSRTAAALTNESLQYKRWKLQQVRAVIGIAFNRAFGVKESAGTSRPTGERFFRPITPFARNVARLREAELTVASPAFAHQKQKARARGGLGHHGSTPWPSNISLVSSVTAALWFSQQHQRSQCGTDGF